MAHPGHPASQRLIDDAYRAPGALTAGQMDMLKQQANGPAPKGQAAAQAYSHAQHTHLAKAGGFDGSMLLFAAQPASTASDRERREARGDYSLNSAAGGMGGVMMAAQTQAAVDKIGKQSYNELRNSGFSDANIVAAVKDVGDLGLSTKDKGAMQDAAFIRKYDKDADKGNEALKQYQRLLQEHKKELDDADKRIRDAKTDEDRRAAEQARQKILDGIGEQSGLNAHTKNKPAKVAKAYQKQANRLVKARNSQEKPFKANPGAAREQSSSERQTNTNQAAPAVGSSHQKTLATLSEKAGEQSKNNDFFGPSSNNNIKTAEAAPNPAQQPANNPHPASVNGLG